MSGYFLTPDLCPLEQAHSIRLLTLSGRRGDLGEEERVRLGRVGGVHRLQRIHRALEIAQEEAGVALEVVEIGVVGIELQALVGHFTRGLRMAGLQEVLEQLLPQLLVGRCHAEHLLEGKQRIGRVVGRLILGQPARSRPAGSEDRP